MGKTAVGAGRALSHRLHLTATLLVVGLVAGCSAGQGTEGVAPTPQVSASDAELPVLPEEGAEVPAGTYTAVVNGSQVPDTPTPVIRVPDGYTALPFAVHVLNDGPDARGLSFWDVGEVFSDPCEAGKQGVDPGPSVADLADAIAAQPSRSGTDPAPVTVGGFDGLYLETSVPDDIDFASCGDHSFVSWTSTTGEGHNQFGPGEHDRLWILDVHGYRLVIEGWTMPGATQEQFDEITAMVDSLTFRAAG